MTKIPPKYKVEYDDLLTKARLALARLGHRALEWQLGPNPNITVSIVGHCKHCDIKLKCHQSLRSVNKKISSRIEFCVGDVVIAYIDDGEVFEASSYKDAICEKYQPML